MKNALACPRLIRPFLLPLLSTILLLAACRKDHPPVDTGTATGTLHDWKGNCLPDIAHGAWFMGIAPGDSNYVEVGIYVEKKGTYHIVTDAQDGVRFSDSGTFIATGYQSVRLKPTGIFTHAGTIGFSVSFGGTICGFSINVDTLPAVAGNRWKFTAKGRVYEGPATGRLVVYTDGSGGSEFDIDGHIDNSTDTTISMIFKMPLNAKAVVPGIYPTNDAGGGYFLLLSGHVDLIYRANSLLDDKVLLTMKIAGSTNSPGGGRQVTGTFSGTAWEDVTGTAVEITDGSFSVAQ